MGIMVRKDEEEDALSARIAADLRARMAATAKDGENDLKDAEGADVYYA